MKLDIVQKVDLKIAISHLFDLSDEQDINKKEAREVIRSIKKILKLNYF